MEGDGPGGSGDGEVEEGEFGDERDEERMSLSDLNNEESLSGENGNTQFEDTDENKSTDSVNVNAFTLLLTNARSLAPKINSFVENFHERDTDFCVVTETWLMEDAGLLADSSVCLLYTSPSPRDS